MNANGLIAGSRAILRQHGRSILTGGSIILTVLAVGEGIRATCNAKDIISEKQYEKFEAMGCPEEGGDFKLTREEVIKSVWKCYIWTFLLLGAAIACGITSHVQSNKIIEGSSLAYSSLLETYNMYQHNVGRVLSNKQQRDVLHETVHDIVENDGPNPKVTDIKPTTKIVVSEDTKVLFRDAYSSKGSGYFRMTMNDARIAIAKFNKWLMDNDQATLNDWYDFLGLGHSEMGDVLGWSWMKDGPLYLRAVPDDININDDNEVITVLGLTSDENGIYFSRPGNMY